MKIKHLIAVLFCLTLHVELYAHSDTRLHQEGNELIGLPGTFGTAEFSWENKMMRVGENRINLWAFEKVIPFSQEYEISITSSWYHTTSSLPPYIVIHLKPKDATFEYTILLNLKSLELMKVSLQYFTSGENNSRFVYHELKVAEPDLKRIMSAVTKTPTSRATQ